MIPAHFCVCQLICLTCYSFCLLFWSDVWILCHGGLCVHFFFFKISHSYLTPFFLIELICYCFLHICVFVWLYVCVGGEGKVGKVVDIRGWDTESGRSVASVTWSNGTTNVYRMGHKGKVDLKYVSDGQGGFYYKDHLPKLGKKDRFLF